MVPPPPLAAHLLAGGVGIGAGAGLGTLLVWILSRVGVNLGPEASAAVAGVAAAAFVYIARHGLLGLALLLWRGIPGNGNSK